jgi:predicted aminopeptidase
MHQRLSPKLRLLAAGLVAFILLASAGCESIGYYTHVSSGQLSLLAKRQPVDAVIASLAAEADDRAVQVRQRLALSQQVLAFAESELGLEVGGRYRSYAALDRDSVVWNLVAAPEFSLKPHTWCYPFVGCAPYRGFFDRDKAEKARLRLAADGLDTYVGGVSAYSTLGWFDDPILSTFIDLSEADFVELLIHELSHSRIWAKDDVPFNEAFASFVGREGARVWFASQGKTAVFAAHLSSEANWTRARTLLEETRAALQVVYEGSADDASKRAAKARVLETAAGCLEEMSQATGLQGYRRLVPRLNNAYLASLATYSDQQGAFAVLFADTEGVWADFFTAVEALAGLAAEQRAEAVEALLSRSSEQEVAADGDDAGTEQVQCEALAGHGLDAELAGGEHDHVRGSGDR